MKKIVYLVCAFILVWGCTRDPQELNEKEMQEKSLFSIDEAKQFFENHMSSSLATRSTSDKNGFIPGDFTVDWATAAYSADRTHCNIELAINAQYRFRVLRAEEINGVITAYSAPVYQKLVMVKNVKTDQVSNYVMTLIPNHQYAQRHRNFDPQAFSTYGDHTGFSGLVVYSTLENVSRPVQVCIFRDGRKKADYSIFKEATKRTENFAAIVRTLRGIEVARKAHVATRSGEDDWWYDDYYDGGEIDPVVIVPDYGTWIDPVEIIGTPSGPIDGADSMTNDEWMDTSKPGGEVEPDGTPPDQDVNIGYDGDQSGSGNDGSATDKDVSDTAKDLSDKLTENSVLKAPLEKMANMPVIQLVAILNPFQLTFRADPTTGAIRPDSFELRYRESDSYESSSLGFQMMLVHEAYHIRQYTDSPTYNPNFDYHSEMVNDPRYVDSLREMFPGHTNDFYENLKWAGNQESQDYKNLPSGGKADLDDFFKDNGIPY